MFVARAQQRKHRSYKWTAAIVLGAIGLIGLVIVLARSGPDGVPASAAPPATVAITTPQTAAPVTTAGNTATAAQPDPAIQQKAADLQAEVAKSSQELDNLRATADQVRAEVTALREQRDNLLRAPTEAQPRAADAPANQQSPASQQNPASQPNRPAQPVALAQPVQPAATPNMQQSAASSEHRPTIARHPHSAHGYMLLAHEQLQSGRTAEAEDALEKAETRVLNSNAAIRIGQDPADSPLVDTIENARRALRSGDTARALRLTGSVLPKPPADRHSSASR